MHLLKKCKLKNAPIVEWILAIQQAHYRSLLYENFISCLYTAYSEIYILKVLIACLYS